MWRQGDVLFAAVDALPEGATRLPHGVLAEGEVTGHRHRVGPAGGAELYDGDGTLFLRVVGDAAAVVHEEHEPVTLPRGTYRVWRQREYTPRAVRTVLD